MKISHGPASPLDCIAVIAEASFKSLSTSLLLSTEGVYCVGVSELESFDIAMPMVA
jgi:hypothetical protein